MKQFFTLCCCLLLIICAEAQEIPYIEKDLEIDPTLKGTLLKPLNKKSFPLVILIAGSGPTDRDGNQKHLKTNSLKLLAERLSKENIATFRYDKRILAEIMNGAFKEEKVSFDGFIEDAKLVVNYFKRNPQYTNIFIAGHSQGSLVGMVAAQEHVAGFISLAGAGQPIDKVLTHQIENTAPTLVAAAKEALEKLKKGKKTNNYPVQLEPIFRKSVQPFMISWIQYNPYEEIKKLKVPVLIINGDKDLQVPIEEAEKLKEAHPEADLKIIKNMNHVLKNIDGDGKIDTKAISYSNPDVPLSEDLVTALLAFIK